MSDKPTIEVTIAAPVETVWQALRDKDQLRRWHGWEYDEGGLDKEIDTIYFSDETEDAANHRLELQGGDVFTLEEAAGGTRLRIVRAAYGASPEWDDYYDDITQGWTSFTQQLKFALERQPGKDRKTLFFSGRGETSPIDALDLSTVAQLDEGKRYETQLAGVSSGGEVWFCTEAQLGLTVDAWGEGLLVVAYQPAKKAAMAILNTYGVSDSELDDLRSEWTTWWSSRYPA
jgi:hypothetical protein